MTEPRDAKMQVGRRSHSRLTRGAKITDCLLNSHPFRAVQSAQAILPSGAFLRAAPLHSKN